MSAHIVLAKHWRHSRTIWANALAAATAGLALLAQELPNFRERVPAGWYLGFVTLLAVVNVWLRLTTQGPIRRGKLEDRDQVVGDPAGKKV